MHITASASALGLAASAAPEVVESIADSAGLTEMGLPWWVRIPLVMSCGLAGGFVVICHAAQREGITVTAKRRQPIGYSTMIVSAMVALFTSQLLPRAVSLLGGDRASVDLVMAVAFVLGVFAYPLAAGIGCKLGAGRTNPLTLEAGKTDRIEP